MNSPRRLIKFLYITNLYQGEILTHIIMDYTICITLKEDFKSVVLSFFSKLVL